MSLRRRSSSSITNNDNESRFRFRTSISVQAPEAPKAPPSTDRASIFSISHLVLIAILSISPWVPSVLLQQKVHAVREKVREAQETSEAALLELNQALDSKKQLKDKVRVLELENAQLLTTLKKHGNEVDPDNNLFKLAEQDEEVYMRRIDDLERSIQLWSKLRLEQKYAKSKEQQHLQFRFNLLNWADQTSQSFAIETASFDDAAHAIAVFDETVKQKILLNSAPTLEAGTHGTCVNLQSRVNVNESTEKAETIRFVEMTATTHMLEGQYNVLIGRRGFRPVISFCAGKAERGLNEKDIESVFAMVVSGTEFLETLMHPSDDDTREDSRDWRLQSIDQI